MSVRTRTRRRTAILAALALPLCLIGVSFAQPQMPLPGARGGAGGLSPPGPGAGFRGDIGPPGGGLMQWEFTCSNCGRVVKTSASRLAAENISKCPYCGVRFDNTMAGRIEAHSERASGPPLGTSPAAVPPARAGAGNGSMVLLIVFVVGGVLLLLVLAGIGAVIWMVSTAPRASGRRVVKRRPKPSSTHYDPI